MHKEPEKKTVQLQIDHQILPMPKSISPVLFDINDRRISPPPAYIEPLQPFDPHMNGKVESQVIAKRPTIEFPLDPNYLDDHDNMMDKPLPKPIVNTCFCCCNLLLGTTLTSLLLAVSFSFTINSKHQQQKNILDAGAKVDHIRSMNHYLKSQME